MHFGISMMELGRAGGAVGHGKEVLLRHRLGAGSAVTVVRRRCIRRSGLSSMARDPRLLASVYCLAYSHQLPSPDRTAIRHSSGKIPSLHPCTAAVNRSEFGSRSLKAVLAPSARPERTSDKRLRDPRVRLLIRRLDNY